MKNMLYTIASALFLFLQGQFLAAQDPAQFIYGTVTTLDDETYEGFIRWGSEEVFWFDFFNSSKPENDNLKWLSKDELETLNEKDGNGSMWSRGKKSWSYSNDNTHTFACQFGDIASIKLRSKDRVFLKLKNGDTIELKGGSNDIGARVQVSDSEVGIIKIDWNKIDKVDFKAAPNNAKHVFGKPLYGKVKTTRTTFEGYLQWDHDERLTVDELNGESDDGDLDIAFGNITNLKKSRGGTLVTLKSGRTFHLTGSNDVDDDNRGIIVNSLGGGRVDIPWEEFEEMIISDNKGPSIKKYKDFDGDKKLSGRVKTIQGETLSGYITYDLDEVYQLEILNGVMDDIEYFIPFTHVKEIYPKNREESKVVLTNGTELFLEDKVDVNEDNDGLLIYTDIENARYLRWDEIEQIEFN